MRNKNNKHLGIEIDPELHYKLHYISKYYGRSANGEILYLIRQEIKAIKSTKQMMLTMKMISSARIKKAQQQMEDGRPFAKKMAVMIDNLRKDIQNPSSEIHNLPAYRFFDNSSADKNSVGLLLITADKGLCGAFNAVALRAALKWVRDNSDKEKYVFVVGKKGRDFMRRLKIPKLHIAGELIGIFPRASYAHAAMIKDTFAELSQKYNISTVDLIYNDFKSMASQTLVSKRFLPFDFDEVPGEEDVSDFIFEPSMMEIFLTLIPRYLSSSIYRYLLESQAAELAARMNAMEAASKNAGEIADNLSVKLNKVRQATITNEITEIVSGANALNN
ncbi:ATP synthase F1 subunit gamma [Candidatus Proelusimicrobium excrementi]|uniref:ATP synthase F1 subunit gamma n=1 Tax=Candidatus Proelusimicrobium excrementi TaxID=3416222 RepID=UPI003D0B6AA6